ncbi:MAG: hypothetical protein IJK66_03210 [Bacilli bacterium]|nr:hypothetical protein [Bacilli bacterium]
MKRDNELVEFILGVVFLAVGLFMLSKRVIVSSGFSIFSIGNFDLTTGTIVIPLMIGIILRFVYPKSFIPKLIVILSSIFIVVAIIMSVKLRFVPTSLFDYLLIVGLIAVGTGLLLKTLTKKQS